MKRVQPLRVQLAVISAPPRQSERSQLRDRMTRYLLSRRVKLSHLMLLFCADHIGLLLSINRLAKCKHSASILLYKLFYQANISLRRDSLAKRLTLSSFGRGDGSLTPMLGEPREQSNEIQIVPQIEKKTKVGVNVSEVGRHPANSTDQRTQRTFDSSCNTQASGAVLL